MWSFQFDTDVCPLPSFRFTRPWGVTTTGGTGAADAVLQPGAVGEGVSLVRRPGRRQTFHACIIVLCGLCLILLHHTGKAASVGGGAGEVLTLRDGRGPATEIRTVLGSCEHLRRALIGRVVRFGVLRDVATVGGLLRIWGVLSAPLLDFLNVFNTNGTASPGAERARLFPSGAFPRDYQRLFYCSYPYGTASTSIFTGTFAWDK